MNELIEKDAERYRFLKQSNLFCIDERCADGQWEPLGADMLDDAIDAAMLSHKPRRKEIK